MLKRNAGNDEECALTGELGTRDEERRVNRQAGDDTNRLLGSLRGGNIFLMGTGSVHLLMSSDFKGGMRS